MLKYNSKILSTIRDYLWKFVKKNIMNYGTYPEHCSELCKSINAQSNQEQLTGKLLTFYSGYCLAYNFLKRQKW